MGGVGRSVGYILTIRESGGPDEGEKGGEREILMGRPSKFQRSRSWLWKEAEDRGVDDSVLSTR